MIHLGGHMVLFLFVYLFLFQKIVSLFFFFWNMNFLEWKDKKYSSFFFLKKHVFETCFCQIKKPLYLWEFQSLKEIQCTIRSIIGGLPRTSFGRMQAGMLWFLAQIKKNMHDSSSSHEVLLIIYTLKHLMDPSRLSKDSGPAKTHPSRVGWTSLGSRPVGP